MRRRDLLAFALCPPPPDPVQIVAHRGALHRAPENTIEAFEQARAAGADYVEVDVRATADGALILMHDSTVDRTTNGRGSVDTLSLAAIRRLRPPVPTFAEVLAWGRQRGVRIDVDHKAGSVEQIARHIRSARMTERVVIEGPRERLARFAALLPGVATMPKVTSPDDVAAAVALLGTRIIRLSLSQLDDPAYPAAVRAAGARVSVTLLGHNDNAEAMCAALARGARIIETDFPELLRSIAPASPYTSSSPA